MRIRSYFKQMLLLIALYSPFCRAKDIIFDFGGVLILTNHLASFRQLGILNIASCSYRLGINPFYLDHYIKSRLFEFLDQVISIDQLNAHSYEQTYDEKGNKLPMLMSGWLQGYISSSDMLALIEEAIEKNLTWFKCAAEKRIIHNTTRLIFTPEIFVRSRTISPAGVAFIKKCKKQGHRVYGLSNWDAQSFAVLKQQHPELFDLFDGIVISAEAKANKPHATIYQTLLARYELKPQDCWFIDDQQDNIDAAKKLGINAIRHTSTFANLIKKIKLAHTKQATKEI